MKLEKPMSTAELTAEFENTFSKTDISYLSPFIPTAEGSTLKEFTEDLLEELTTQGMINEKDGKCQITEYGNDGLKERLKNARYGQ
jgi:methionyl-tRNA synthetase